MITDPTHRLAFRALREQAGMTQQQIAEHVGVTVCAVSLYEKTGDHLGLAKVMRALRYMRKADQ